MSQPSPVRPCSRCGRHIDDMETVHAVRRQVMCDQCYRDLSKSDSTPTVDAGYTVKRLMFGREVVLYRCPYCRNQLRSPLYEANSKTQCPDCYKPFITPGGAALAAHMQKAKKAEIAKAMASMKKREAANRKRAAAAAQAAYHAAHPPPPPPLVWYGKMQCHSCGYQWNSRRGTPPAKCAGCGSRSIVAIRVPRRGYGCLTMVAIGFAVAAAMYVKRFV